MFRRRPSSSPVIYRHAEPNPCADSRAATRSRGRRRRAARARACPPMPEPAARLVEGEAAPVVGDASARRRRPRDAGGPGRARPPRAGRRSRAPPGRRGRRRAGRPSGRSRERRPSASKLGAIPLWRPSSLDVAGERRLEAEVVERGRPQLAGERRAAPASPGWRAPRISASSRGELGRRLLAHRLEAQQQPGQRLVDLVVEVAGDPGALLLLGVERGARGAPALGLEPLEHAAERQVQALDLLGPAAGSARRAGWRPGARGRRAPSRRRAARAGGSGAGAGDVDERSSAPTASPSTIAACGFSPRFDVRVGGDRRGDHRGDDQQQVDGQDLGEQVAAAHRI